MAADIDKICGQIAKKTLKEFISIQLCTKFMPFKSQKLH
jgi:hypothetical protein